MKKIAILTSGGDAPGMNAALRSIVLSCQYHSLQTVGFFHGYNGLIDDEYTLLDADTVNDTLHLGGTVLKSARCKQMLTEEGVLQAVNTLRKHSINTLIVIGGDGSFRGLQSIKQHWDGQVIGLPGTIDNDLYGCDTTIGFATAVHTATQAIDKIRDTANAFDRVFIVEVMGRHSGHIAFNVGLATGAESILSFENYTCDTQHAILSELISNISTQQKTKSTSYLIVIAENLWSGGAQALKNELLEQGNIDSAVCVLGHIQRGGSPIPEDRLLGTQLGIQAVNAALAGQDQIMIGYKEGKLAFTPLESAVTQSKPVSAQLLDAHQQQLTCYLT